MEATTNTTQPQLEQSIARLKTVVAALESRISNLVEQSKKSEDYTSQLDDQKHQLHVLEEQVTTLQSENASLKEKLEEAEGKYTKLHSISEDVQGQIDTAINDLQLLLEKETVDS